MSDTCCCGHDRSEHEFASDDYPTVCVHLDEAVAAVADDPLEAVCACLHFDDPDTVYE